MSVNQWRGDALAVAQVDTYTIGTATSGDTYGVTINNITIFYTAGVSDTTATITTNLTNLLAASNNPPEFLEVTWTSDNVSVITGTATTPGVPFVASVFGTGTVTHASVTASSGPNHADTALNWTLGAIPGAGDDVLIQGSGSLLYGLQNMTSAAYNSFRVMASFTGQIGLPVFNQGGGGFAGANTSGYYEYRTRAWPLHTAVPVTIGEGTGSGLTLGNFNVTTALNFTVLGTGGRQQQATTTSGGVGSGSVPVLNISGCSSGTLAISGGDVGICADQQSLTATVATVGLSGGLLTTGVGGTVTTLNQNAGTTIAYGVTGTLDINSGTYTQFDGSLTTIVANGGTVNYSIAGTITSATFQGQGGQGSSVNIPTLNFTGTPAAKTLTNGSFTGGVIFNDPSKTVTLSNAITIDNASQLLSTFGYRYTFTRS